MCDIYDVYSLAREGRLHSLKVKILRDKRYVQDFLSIIQNASAVVMQSSDDVHPLCECDILSTRTLQSYEPNLLCRQV